MEYSVLTQFELQSDTDGWTQLIRGHDPEIRSDSNLAIRESEVKFIGCACNPIWIQRIGR